MDNAMINPVFERLENEVKKTDIQLQTLNEVVESFVKLNGSGDGVRRKIRTSLKKSKGLQEICKKK